MHHRLITAWLLVLGLLILAACSSGGEGTLDDVSDDDANLDDDNDGGADDDLVDDDDDDDDTPFEGDLWTLEVIPEFVAEPAGFTVQYRAEGTDDEGQPVTNITPEWSIADDSVAEIDANGLATTLAYGQTTVIAQWTNENDNLIEGTAVLWVTGDVFVLDGDGRRVGMIDLSDDSVTNDYFGEPLAGDATEMGITQGMLGVFSAQTTVGLVDTMTLDPEADSPKRIKTVELLSEHTGTRLTATLDYTYIVEPEWDDVAVFFVPYPNFSDAVLAGLLLLRDGAHPVDVTQTENDIIVLANNGNPDAGEYAPGTLYYFSRNVHVVHRTQTAEWLNPVRVEVVKDSDGTWLTTVLSAGDGDTQGAHLDFYNVDGHYAGFGLPGDVATLATDSGGFVWLGPASGAEVMLFDVWSAQWVAPPDDPLVLPGGQTVTAITANPGRLEFWVATAEGTVYRYDRQDLTMLHAYDFAADFRPIDIVVW